MSKKTTTSKTKATTKPTAKPTKHPCAACAAKDATIARQCERLREMSAYTDKLEHERLMDGPLKDAVVTDQAVKISKLEQSKQTLADAVTLQSAIITGLRKSIAKGSRQRCLLTSKLESRGYKLTWSANGEKLDVEQVKAKMSDWMYALIVGLLGGGAVTFLLFSLRPFILRS